MALVYSFCGGNGLEPLRCPRVTTQVVLRFPVGANQLRNAVIRLMKESCSAEKFKLIPVLKWIMKQEENGEEAAVCLRSCPVFS